MDIFPEFFLRTDVLEAIFLMSTCEQLSLVVVPVRRNNTLPSSNPGIFFSLVGRKIAYLWLCIWFDLCNR